jgi:UTP--glucose-1-phosphate uridylyltransferase
MQQSEGCNKPFAPQIPLVLMNSFKTHADTLGYLRKKGLEESKWPRMFVQHKYPKINQNDLSPASCPENRELEWNPPGHGDLYAALLTSGMLDDLLSEGKQYAFVSNADNLGAVVDSAILGYFAQGEYPFMMEVARRTPADTKGGHLARLANGKLTLREIAQCPEKDLDSFQDIEKYGFFNTNNIWLNLKLLREYIDHYGLPQLPLILNPKTLNPRDENSPGIYQVETAMGAAISCFDRAAAIQVPRKRFIPVKKTNDLLLVRSDCYLMNDNCELQLSPQIEKDPPKISLDPDYYKKIDQLDERFPYGPPSLKQCQSFAVKGDALFEDNIVCRADVSVENYTGKQVVISSGSTLEGKVDFS